VLKVNGKKTKLKNIHEKELKELTLPQIQAVASSLRNMPQSAGRKTSTGAVEKKQNGIGFSNSVPPNVTPKK